VQLHGQDRHLHRLGAQARGSQVLPDDWVVAAPCQRRGAIRQTADVQTPRLATLRS